jgi:hypothetical protein
MTTKFMFEIYVPTISNEGKTTAIEWVLEGFDKKMSGER